MHRGAPSFSERPQGGSASELYGGWLVSARVAWLALVVGTAVLFTVSVPAYFSVLHEPCRVGPCIGGQPEPGDLLVLHDMGIPVGFYAAHVLALDLLVAVVFCSVAAIVFWQRSRERAALFASFALAMFGLTWPGVFETVKRFGGWGEPVGGFLVELGLASLVVFLLVFPDGRFVPRWTRWMAVFAVVQLASHVLFPGSFLADPPQAINVSAFVGLWGTCAFAQAYRYRMVSGPIQRQQIKWLVFGVAALAALLFAYFLPLAFFPQLDQPGVASLSYDLIGRTLVGSLAFLLIPASIGVAIMRYRLWDIDLIINRTLVYGSLTVLLSIAYYGSVVVLEQALRVLTGQGSTLIVVASTLGIAALFGPLRLRVQGFVDRRFYRRKYDAAKTLAAFNARLREKTDLDALGDDLVGVARGTVQPEHVSLWLRPETDSTGQQTD